MIVTDCNIQVNNDKSTADKKIIVYRGDYNVQVTFTITQSNNYRYRGIDSSGENLIESTNASYGQILIKNQDEKGVSVLSEIAPTNEGKVTLTILKEHIDELIELGPYDYQIRLFSAEKEARLTIPPIEGQLIVKEPLIFDSGDDNNIVDEAIVDKAAIINDGEELPVFDEEGNYIKTEWISGDIITAEKLNKTEDAIDHLVSDSVNYATKDELPPIRVIGSDNPDEPYVLTGNEFTDEEYENGVYLEVIFRNVIIGSFPEVYNGLVNVSLSYWDRYDDGVIWKDMYITSACNGERDFVVHPETGVIEEDWGSYFAYYEDLENYATKGYVDEAVSNIEIPVGYNKENAILIYELHVTEKNTIISSAGFHTDGNATYQLVISVDGSKYRIDSSSVTQGAFGKIINFTDNGELGIQAQISVGAVRINNKVVIDPYRAMLTINSSIPEEGYVISLVAYNSIQPYVTEDVLAYAINNLDIPEVDTSNLATKEELNNALGDISDLLDLFNGDGEVN